MTLIQLKSGLITLLRGRYPPDEYSYYGPEVTEGYKRPSFFTQLKPVTMENANYNATHNVFSFYIVYFQISADEPDMLAKIDEIRELFGSGVRIGKRYIHVSDFGFDYIGDERNTLEISVELEYFGMVVHENVEETMESIAIAPELKEG